MPVTVTVGKGKPATRTRRTASRRRRKGVLTAVWGVLTAAVTVTLALVESGLWLVALLAGLLMTALTAVAERFEQELPAPASKRAVLAQRNPRGNGRGKARPRRSGPRKPPKPSCSAACQRSHPRSPCECKACGGRMTIDPATGAKRGHGSKYPGRV